MIPLFFLHQALARDELLQVADHFVMAVAEQWANATLLRSTAATNDQNDGLGLPGSLRDCVGRCDNDTGIAEVAPFASRQTGWKLRLWPANTDGSRVTEPQACKCPRHPDRGNRSRCAWLPAPALKRGRSHWGRTFSAPGTSMHLAADARVE